MPAYTVDVEANYTPPTEHDGPNDADYDRIMSGLKDLVVRLDRVEQHPEFRALRARTNEPSTPLAPRVMAPQEAYSAAQQAYLANQAKINQRRAHEAGFAPPHPDDVKQDLEEQRQIGTHDNATAYGKAIHAHKMIGPRPHLTFFDRHTRARCAASTSDIRAMRNYEALLMRDMVHTVAKHLGDI